MKNIILLIFVTVSFSAAYGQQDRDRAMRAFKKLAEKYRSIPYLSFDVEYSYSIDKQPGESLEKIAGSFKMNGDKFQYSLANTQVTYNGDMSVIFYNDDSVIYLSKSSSSLMNNPVSGLDSVLNIQGYEFLVVEEGKKDIITMYSQDTSNVKKIIYEINKSSGLLEKMVQVINDSYMYEHPQQRSAGDTNSYAVISTIFSNYSTRSFDTKIFQTDKYVTKVNGKYQPVHPYQSYTVFNANPGL